MNQDIVYIKKPQLDLQEVVSGWKARIEGIVKWIDCDYCTYQIVGTLEHDAMAEMASHRLTCKRRKQ